MLFTPPNDVSCQHSGPWHEVCISLPGVALDAHDRIRIVPDTVLCGLTGSATMHSTVLALTSPKGARTVTRLETFRNF